VDRLADAQIAEMSGQASLPRKSGEMVFHDPWERRIFALAVALCEQGLYPWDDFRSRLIAEITAVERAPEQDAAPSRMPAYYEHWLASFERLLVEKSIVTKEEIVARNAGLKPGQT
jgi:nitrile hydratase